MNDRKQHVISMAHRLFVDKGFQATSIQDILDYSGISKGTFYNYFSSKNELLIALIKTIYQKLEHDRNELLIGQSSANIEIFIRQIELQMKTNRANKLISLFEEVNFSNDVELKQFINQGNLRIIGWLYYRFIDIFGESKKIYLLDCAIMFMGMLSNNLKYYSKAHEANNSASIYNVVKYTVERIQNIVNEVPETGQVLFQPELLNKWLPDCQNQNKSFQKKISQTVSALKKTCNDEEDCAKYIELLDFVQEELLHFKNPRKFLIESALSSLKVNQSASWKKDFQFLEQLILEFFKSS
jgi:transcriptional regulator with XRE-family HTH domain